MPGALLGFERVGAEFSWNFYIPNYFFLQLLKITFSLKILGAIAPKAPKRTTPLHGFSPSQNK